MQTLLHAFHKDIISLNLHNNSLGVGICSPITDKKEMSSESYTSCPNSIVVDSWLESSFYCNRVYFSRCRSTYTLENDGYIFLIAYFLAPKPKADSEVIDVPKIK